MSQYSPVITQTEDALVEIRESGGNWMFLPGVASISETGSEAPTREVSTFSAKVQIVGNVSPPTIEFSIAGFTPLHRTTKILRDARDDNSLISFRYRFEGRTLDSSGTGNTASIATSGAVTFSWQDSDNPTVDFTEEHIGPGAAIKIGANYHIIDTISATGVVTVYPAPSAQVAAAVFTVEVPPLYRPAFPARVMTFDDTDAGSESQLATTLSIAPTAVLPQMRAGVPS